MHAEFFQEVLKVPAEKVRVIPVGAEEAVFKPCKKQSSKNKQFTVLFYGSYIPLQGVDVIVKAALLTRDSDIKWIFIGDGPLKNKCVVLAGKSENIVFLDWVPYESLPDKICSADILLGIFGKTPKARRVIPNKVYQALACDKPVITQKSLAYPKEISDVSAGFIQIADIDPEKLYESVSNIKATIESNPDIKFDSKKIYEKFFSQKKIREELSSLLKSL